MPFPDKLPEWATAPSDPPNDIIEPSAGVKTEGWDPDQRPPAGWVNWLQNLTYKWLKALATLHVVNAVLLSSNSDVFPGISSAPQDVFFDGFRWYAIGPNAAINGPSRSFDIGSNQVGWTAASVAAGLQSQECGASDGAGLNTSVVITGGAGGELVRSADSGDNWAISEAGGSISSSNVLQGIWSPENNLFVFFTTGAEIFTSPAGSTGSWASRTVPGGHTPGNSQSRPARRETDGRIVVISPIGVCYSDDATSWFGVSGFGVSGVAGDVSSVVGWTDDDDGGYFLLGTLDGDVYRSADGTSWTLVASDVLAALPGGATLDGFSRGMLSDGGGLWVAGPTFSGTNAPSTYVYSLDGGLTWQQAPYTSLFFTCLGYGQRRWCFGTSGGGAGLLFVTPAAA